MNIFNFIKKFFKTEPTQSGQTEFIPDPNTYYFHEDFYCQIEYLPKENFRDASRVATEITAHSEKTFSGVGWTSCYVRNEASVPIRSKNFSVQELADLLLKDGFSEYSIVTNSFGPVLFPCIDTRAFWKKSIVLCIDFKGEIIENIWHNDPPHQDDNAVYKELLLTMADKYNLLLADWWRSTIVDISNPMEIENYFGQNNE